MRIAYSCAGEGFGHAARMVALCPDLARRHELALFVPREVEAFVRSALPPAGFGSVRVEGLPCFTLAKRGDRIDYGATAFRAVRGARDFASRVQSLSRDLRAWGADAVLSDFEPYLPWAARLAGIPVVQMNHPGIVDRHVEAHPSSWAAALAALLMQGPWDRRVLVSFYGGDVGPVVRASLLRRHVRDEGFLAVNLKEEVRAAVVPALEAVPGLRWKLYPAPGMDFDEGLASCSAVLTGAGHQTLSEALCLGKPVLALPQEGQYEQLLNARMLERSGRGAFCAVRDLASVLPRFLSRLDEYRDTRVVPFGFEFRDCSAQLLAALERGFGEVAKPRVPAAKARPRAAAV